MVEEHDFKILLTDLRVGGAKTLALSSPLPAAWDEALSPLGPNPAQSPQERLKLKKYGRPDVSLQSCKYSL